MAASAKEVLSALAQINALSRRPRCITSMPGMSGTELLEELRRRPELSGMAVVMSTSAPERAPGGVPVLAKPLDVEALSVLMRRTCQCA